MVAGNIEHPILKPRNNEYSRMDDLVTITLKMDVYLSVCRLSVCLFIYLFTYSLSNLFPNQAVGRVLHNMLPFYHEAF